MLEQALLNLAHSSNNGDLAAGSVHAYPQAEVFEAGDHLDVQEERRQSFKGYPISFCDHGLVHTDLEPDALQGLLDVAATSPKLGKIVEKE